MAVRYPRSVKTTPQVSPETPAPMMATRSMIKIIYVQWVAPSYKMPGDGFIESRCADGKSSCRRTDFDRRRARIVSVASRRIGRACQCQAGFGKGKKLRWVRRRDSAFYRTEGDEDHYVLSFEQIDQKLDELSAADGVQILMQGGHHPKLPFRWYIELLQHIRQKYPHINIHGFSPPEFQHFAETFAMPLRDVISEFKKAGLGSIPGGGGEILVDRVRKKISPLKINS